MAQKTISIKIDENEIDKRRIIAATKTINLNKEYAPKEMKRAALGELGNRAVTRAVSQKENGTVKNADYKHVKPRVDSHWKSKNKDMVVQMQQKIEAIRNKSTKCTTDNHESKNGSIEIKDIPKIVVTKAREEPKLNERKLTIPKVDKISPVDAVISHSHHLLNQIENIDADNGNLFLVNDYAKDVYDYMFELENLNAVREKYLEGHVEITPIMRTILIDWLNETHYQFQLVLETYFLTVALVDTYLQKHPTTKRKQLQLVGCTAMLIASKYEEVYAPEIKEFVYITDRTYNKKQICEMERAMLVAAEFKVGKPLPIHFLRRFSKAADADAIQHLMAKYFIELMSIEYTMVHYKKSLMAAASLYLALNISKIAKGFNPKSWTPTLEHYSTYTASELQPIAVQIIKLVRNASKAKYQAIYVKYSSSSNESIAKKLDTPDIKMVLQYLLVSELKQI